MKRTLLVAGLLLAAVLAGADSSHAGFPAAHGRLLVDVENEDGVGMTLLPVTKGDHVLQLLFGAGSKGEASMSPDGTRMAIRVTTLGEHPQIAVVDLFGEGDVLTSDASNKARPAWSPDGAKLVYASDKGGTWDIYTLPSDGLGTPVDLTSGSGADNWNPRWSPDGSRIAFESDRAGSVDIFTMTRNGAGVKDVTNAAGEDRLGDWSPDSKRIVFTSTRGGDREPYTMNADGSAVTQVANEHGGDFNPVFSPDGKTIAFSSARDGDSDVYLIGTGGGPETKLTHNATEDVVQDWQPLLDSSPPETRAFPAHGVRGRALRLRYRVSENTGVAAVHIEATYRSGEFGADYSPRKVVAGKTYTFTVPKSDTRDLPRTFKFCVLASDSSANLSAPSCARVHIRRRHRKR